MIIVMGYLVVAAADRVRHLVSSQPAVQAARTTPGCLYFAVSADAVEPSWVNVAERWASRAELDAFRSAGTDADDVDPFAHIREFHVEEFEVADHRG